MCQGRRPPGIRGRRNGKGGGTRFLCKKPDSLAFLPSPSPPCQRISRKISPMRTGSEELYALNSGAGVSGRLCLESCHRVQLPVVKKKVVVLQIGKRIVISRADSSNKDLRSGTMKKVLAAVVGILFVGGIVVGLSTSAAIAGPHGHHGGHHGHHGGHWGFGPGVIATGSSVPVDDGCTMVKQCYINKFGEKRCRWVQECD